MPDERDTVRIDRWLWFARFFKTRALATKLVSSGHVRVNSAKISKPAFKVGPGDTLTFPKEKQIRVVRIIDAASRRGPAPEAQALYEDLTPKEEPQAFGNKSVSHAKNDIKGRPTKKNRRKLMASRRDMLD